MNPAGPGPRMRAPPNGTINGPQRPPRNHENGTPVAAREPMVPKAQTTDKAELFEDEKKRIVASCFAKKDPADGQATESYITHVRVVEDAAYPSTPPPPDSLEENKKKRVIIVAVRKNGRVRMHKARENDNNTFSIGKTWNLDDLNSIQSFTNAVPVTPEDQQNKQLAGALGFIVTISKPYYWESQTPKEKDFFIFSLVKIYKKYTGGSIPELLGFDHQELERFSAAMGPTPGAARPARPEPPKMDSNGSTQSSLTPRPPATQQPIRQPSGPQAQLQQPAIGQPQERGPPPRSENRPRQPQERPFQERPLHDRQFQEHPLRPTDSEERIAQIPGSFPQSDFVRDLRPQNSQTQLRKKRSESSLSQDPNHDRTGTSYSEDLSNNEPQYRVLHSARGGDDRARQNGNHVYGPQYGTPPTSSQTPAAFRTGAPPSSHPSQESLKEQIRPPTVDPKATSLVPKPLRKQTSIESAKPTTIEKSSRETSNEQWYPTPDPSKDVLHPPVYHRAPSSEVSRYDESRPLTAVRDTTNDVTPPSTNTERTEPDLAVAPSSQSAMPTPPDTPTESHRPGLGPMIKTKRSNKEIASQFRKAATAYNAFKPRAGGAADRLREHQQSPTGVPDGISGVVPAPSLLKNASQGIANESRSQTPDLLPAEQPDQHGLIPTLKVDSPPPKPASPVKAQPLNQQPPSTQDAPQDELDQLEKPMDEQRRKRRSDHSSKYAKALALDPQLLIGRTIDIETALNDFGWGEEPSERCSYEELQANIEQELERAEAGGWINAIEQNDDRIVALGGMMDRVISECEELDGLLTLYGVELSTLSEDVAYIEAQSQGLQVQAANQKLLHTELKMLLDTISISSSDLRALKEASLTKPSGIHAVETTLSQLYTAMMTIDPKIRRNAIPQKADGEAVDHRLSSSIGSSELSSIRAVRERRDGYQVEIDEFVQRFKQYMSVKFKETESLIRDSVEIIRTSNTVKNPPRLDVRLREGPQQALWTYSPLFLFSREMALSEWEQLIHMYEASAKAPYQEEFRDNVFAWKRIARKATPDEQDLLFTSPEKESESLVGRRLTVKRSKTVRTEVNHRISSGDKPNDGKVDAFEAFSGALNEMARVVFMEQNFITELFHLTSAHNADFNDAVRAGPEGRAAKDLMERKPFEADRNLARGLHRTMEEIFSFWPADVQKLVEWVVKQDQLQGVGVIAALEAKLLELEDTNQEYLVQTINKIHDRLANAFNRFIDEQIHGIEDTKVKIKKRKGVIAFMKTFPNFSLAIEAMLPPLTQLPVRTLIDDAYRKINRAMFESLKFIAKESPTAAQPAPPPSGGDPEDKEVLNYHILLIENMNHYIEEIYAKDNAVLSDWKLQAQQEMAEHMDLYLAAVLRRPLGKLLDFVESAETQLANLPADAAPTALATRPSHSRSVVKKTLGVYDAKEMRKGIETLKKRVEKHFGDGGGGGDVGGLSRGLVAT
ncbi:MAG: hypothetical protein Q9212_006891, partial [Teloschistes hypoglaucus]